MKMDLMILLFQVFLILQLMPRAHSLLTNKRVSIDVTTVAKEAKLGTVYVSEVNKQVNPCIEFPDNYHRIQTNLTIPISLDSFNPLYIVVEEPDTFISLTPQNLFEPWSQRGTDK